MFFEVIPSQVLDAVQRAVNTLNECNRMVYLKDRFAGEFHAEWTEKELRPKANAARRTMTLFVQSCDEHDIDPLPIIESFADQWQAAEMAEPPLAS